MNNREKYIVLNVDQLNALVKMAHAYGIEEDNANTVVLKLVHSGKKWPRQLRYTDKFRRETYDYYD